MKSAGSLAFLFANLGLLLSAAGAERLNLIAICTDDQGRWGMAAYGNGEVHTPNMDRLAAEGALFLNAFCNTPVCSPSRATYLTGRYPSELGITDWISPDEAESGVGLAAPTWPEALQEAGYQTALIGKWHLGEKPEFHPTRKGFDYFMGFLAGGNRPMDPVLEVKGKVRLVKGPLPDILTDDAIRWVRERREAGEPFALCLHYRAPHTPYLPVPEEDAAHYEGAALQNVPNLPGLDIEHIRQQHIDYYSSISSIDRNIGRLLDALKKEGLDENTVVLFTSDHGYNLGRHYVSTKGNGAWLAGGRIAGAPKRPNMWDTSLAVPLAIRWPGVVKPGTRIEAPVSFVDFYRTMLGILDVPLKSDAASPRGVDFSPLLRGEADGTLAGGEVFGQYDLHNGGLAYLRMIRTERHKFVQHFRASGQDELYDLQSDPGEVENLLRRSRPRDQNLTPVWKELQARLEGWMGRVDDPVLTDPY